MTCHTVELIYVLAIFFFAVDCTWSGIILLRDKDPKRMPKFLCYLLLKFYQKNQDKFKKQDLSSRLVRAMYSQKAFTVYFLISGPMALLIAVIHVYLFGLGWGLFCH